MALAAIFLLGSSAGVAQDAGSAESCARSFPARLRDAKAAIERRDERTRDTLSARAWFQEHCRLLSEAELAAREPGDPDAFVCDTWSGRPSNLRAAVAPLPAVSEFQSPRAVAQNRRCAEHDARERVSLDLSDAEDIAAPLQVNCYGISSERCTRARAVIAEHRRLSAAVAAQDAARDAGVDSGSDAGSAEEILRK